jgi:hypothetical protein
MLVVDPHPLVVWSVVGHDYEHRAYFVVYAPRLGGRQTPEVPDQAGQLGRQRIVVVRLVGKIDADDGGMPSAGARACNCGSLGGRLPLAVE